MTPCLSLYYRERPDGVDPASVDREGEVRSRYLVGRSGAIFRRPSGMSTTLWARVLTVFADARDHLHRRLHEHGVRR